MGWTFYCDRSRVQTYADEKAEITRICSFENDDEKNEPLQLSKVGSTWYVAVRKSPKPNYTVQQNRFVQAADGSYTFAAVFLVRYDEGCFGYKSMDETMGPVEARAPKSLIRKLSPLQDPKDEDDSRYWAQRWRDRCIAYGSIPSFKAGDVIELGQPLTLANGKVLTKVRQDVCRYRGRNYKVFICEETGSRYRLNKVDLAGSKCVSSALADASPVLAEFKERQEAGA